MKYLLTLIYITLTTGGIYCLKSGGDSLSLAIKNGITLKIGLITMLGFVLYIFSFLLWQKLLATYDLSYIVPITTGIVQIIVLLLSYFAFKEKINCANIVGTLLIVIGVILVSVKR